MTQASEKENGGAKSAGKAEKAGSPFCAALFILLPAILFLLVSLIQYVKNGGSGFLPMPQWNDEAAYYELVKTWLESGMPKGYWGFGGSHAIIGTGGAWSPAILFPYAVWGMLFGWHYSSVAVANAFFFCIANAVLLRLLKPDRAGLFRLALTECLAGHILLYSGTIMSELLRYALAVVLAAMLYRLLFEKEDGGGRIFHYAVVPVYILLITQMYIFFVFAVPIYVFAILKNKKRIWKTIAALFAMAAAAGVSYYLLHLISSNYNIYKTEMLLGALRTGNVWEAVKTFFWMFKTGLLDLYSCFLSRTGHNMFRWFVPFLVLLAGIPFFSLCVSAFLYLKNRNESKGPFWNRDRQISLIVCYSVSLFTVMYITLYSLEAFTFYRGAGIVILFSMVFLSRPGKQEEFYGHPHSCSNWLPMRFNAFRPSAGLARFYIILALYASGLFFVPANMTDFGAERYLTAEEKEEWDALAERLQEAMPLCDSAADAGKLSASADPAAAKEAVRWANTAVLYTMEPRLICAIPAGFGVNFAMYSDEIVTEAGCLVFSLKAPENLRADWLEQSYDDIDKKYGGMIEENYYIQYQDEDYIVYRKRADAL